MDKAKLEEMNSWFQSVADTLAEGLERSSSHFVGVAGKWARKDLVPGLSDLDSRIICDGETSADDWVEIDRVIGEVHLDMVRRHPEWNRINEHTAGAAMSISEVMDERFYNPEYPVWDVWTGPKEWLNELKAYVLKRPFGHSDEHFHLSRFLGFFSPYIHGIDPAVNLGEFEPKYALHSRCWHYFAPPMLSAASVMAGRNFESKRDGIEWLTENGPIREQAGEVLRQVDAHYETEELDDEQRLLRFEEFLHKGFIAVYPVICSSLRHLEVDPSAEISTVKKRLGEKQPTTSEMLMENLRWARTRAARYFFYSHAPEHFEVEHFMAAEMIWLKRLTRPMFGIFQKVLGVQELNPEDCLAQFGISVNREQENAIGQLFGMALLDGDDHEKLGEAYIEAVDNFPKYYRLLDRAVAVVLRDYQPN